VSSRCLRILAIWNQWFIGFVARCRVCRRLVELLYLAWGWVGFDLLSGTGWMCRREIAEAANFVSWPVGWLATA